MTGVLLKQACGCPHPGSSSPSSQSHNTNQKNRNCREPFLTTSLSSLASLTVYLPSDVLNAPPPPSTPCKLMLRMQICRESICDFFLNNWRKTTAGKKVSHVRFENIQYLQQTKVQLKDCASSPNGWDSATAAETDPLLPFQRETFSLLQVAANGLISFVPSKAHRAPVSSSVHSHLKDLWWSCLWSPSHIWWRAQEASPPGQALLRHPGGEPPSPPPGCLQPN